MTKMGDTPLFHATFLMFHAESHDFGGLPFEHIPIDLYTSKVLWDLYTSPVWRSKQVVFSVRKRGIPVYP